MEIYLASEVGAVCDEFSDILIMGSGVIKMRITQVAARELLKQLLEAVEKSEAMPPAPKRSYTNKRS